MTVSSLTGLDYIGAATSGSDLIWLRAFDGQWSGWTLATMTDQSGSNDTVNAGVGPNVIYMGGANQTFLDGAAIYNDTVVGFDQAAGDRIALTGTDTTAFALAHTASQNGGQDTLITLNGGSTILLKGVSAVDTTFFS